MSDWDEVKKLAAEFQRVQLSDAVLKLSDRNCIEIVRKLIKQNKLDVIFTTDGKEYITPEHLLSEIENELYANNGRIYLHELSSILLVDISLIELKANELVKRSSGRIALVLGQLITNEHKDQLAVEINEKLQIKGSITIAEIIKFCDLPPDFVQSIVSSRLRTTIKGVQDPNNPQTYFTETYLDQFRSRITGALNAITKPTTIAQILSAFKFSTKIFTTIAQELVKEKRVRGHFTSYSNNGLFVPETYSKIQNDYVESFLKQNHYIEHDALSRIGITDVKNYFKKCDNLIGLKSCLIDRSIYKQIESGVEDALLEEYLVDLYTIAPSVLNDDDFSVLIDLFIASNKKHANNLVLIGNYVIARKYLEKLRSEFDSLLREKACQDLKDGLLAVHFSEKAANRESAGSQLLSKKEERRKQNLNKSKSGGGTQGREVKTRSTKKKYNKRDEFADDDEADFSFSQNTSIRQQDSVSALKFMNAIEINQKLNKICAQANELSDELLEQLSELLEPLLNDQYAEVAKEVWTSSQTVSGSQIKKTHSELQSTTQQLYNNIYMSNKGLEFLSGESQNDPPLLAFSFESNFLFSICFSIQVNYKHSLGSTCARRCARSW